MSKHVRLWLAVTAVAIWVAAAGVWVTFTSPTEGTIAEFNAMRADAGDIWLREDTYLAVLNDSRSSGRLDRVVAADQHHNPDRIRVLVVGDSFTAGVGLVDMDVRWPHLLEQRLEERWGAGTVEVVAVATPAASTYTYARWLETIDTDNNVTIYGDSDDVTGPFDAVVVGYVYNDSEATFGLDHPIPDHWHDGVAEQFGDGAVIDEYEGAEISGQDGSLEPHNEPYYRWAVQRIAELSGTVVVTKLAHNDDVWRTIDAVTDIWVDAGAVLTPADATRSALTNHQLDELTVTPSDGHPASILQHAYAADTAAALDAVIEDRRLSAAVGGAGRHGVPTRSPIGSVTPNEGAVTHLGDSRWQVVFTGDVDVDRWCGAQRPFRLPLECVDGRDRVIGEHRSFAPQWTPCSQLGHPWVMVSVVGHDVTAVDVNGDPRIRTARFGYDNDGQFVVDTPSAGHRVWEPADWVRGVVAVDTGRDCELGNDPIGAPTVTLELTLTSHN